MLRVPIKQARPGMVLAMNLLHPQRRGTVLLKAGVRLEQPTIDRLREIKCPDCWIDFPGLEFIADYVSTEIAGEHQTLTASISDNFERVLDSAHAKLDFEGYKRGVASLLDSIRNNPKAALYLHELNNAEQPMMRHASTVCMLSLLVGLKLDFYLVKERDRLSASAAQDVSNLGLAAILHDVGLLVEDDAGSRLPWDEPASEPDQPHAEWRQHVVRGYELVRGSIDPTAASAILHHHQHYDGSGFPKLRNLNGDFKAQSGSQIHVFARIISACDRFCRLRFGPDENAPLKPVVSVFKDMLGGERRDWFDPMVVRALMAVAPPYGPGSIVRLSTGLPAVVTAWNASDPCRPEVLPMAELDAGGSFDPIEHEDRMRLDLRTDRQHEIAEIDGVRVLEDNFYPEAGEQFDIVQLGKSFENRAAMMEEQRAAG